jgi:hypothetical protein
MEKYKSKINEPKNSNQNENKIIRSKSKNVYNQQKPKKLRNHQNEDMKPMNNRGNNHKEINEKNIHYRNNLNNNIMHNNTHNEKKSELISLKKKNESLKLYLKSQDEAIKEWQNLLVQNYYKIKLLSKQYSRLKKYLEKSIYEENNKLIKEKLEEEFALKAVEQQIMDEICPNPDKMSYEQLLELEEGVGNVNKGLSKAQINKIPVKPFHKTFFEDNSQCIICMENFTENELVKQLSCGHIFHEDCINQWLEQQKNCPFCKAECICYN